MGISKEDREPLMIHAMLVFGTRPEAIKMCPLARELFKRREIRTTICVTGQHRELLDQVLPIFNITPEYDLGVMKREQSLFDITMAIMDRIKPVLEKEHPSVVLVHGDTTTAFAVSLSCYYLGIEVGHVEAGLRTNNIYSPYPEEFNRQAVGLLAKYHFAPTKEAAGNLEREGKTSSYIYITGNTVIDSFQYTINKTYHHKVLEWVGKDKLILLTAHRRENIGKPMGDMFRAIKRVCLEHSDVKVMYPIHMNPAVREKAMAVFGDRFDRIRLIEPLDVYDFHNLLFRCYMVLTDSGGVQEEATALGKPVLVMRDTTERMEGIRCGTLKLVGTEEASIYTEFKSLLENKKDYEQMSMPSRMYGDGMACKRIADIIERID